MTIEICFETAWSPPEGFYEQLPAGMILQAAFYHEKGMGFYGDILRDLQFSYPRCEDEIEMRRLQEIQDHECSDLHDFMESEWEILREEWSVFH